MYIYWQTMNSSNQDKHIPNPLILTVIHRPFLVSCMWWRWNSGRWGRKQRWRLGKTRIITCVCPQFKYVSSHNNCLSYTITFVHRIQIVDVSQFSSLSQRQRNLRTGSEKTMLKKATFPLVLVHVLEQLSVKINSNSSSAQARWCTIRHFRSANKPFFLFFLTCHQVCHTVIP